MTREDLLESLLNRGYNARLIETNKNGVLHKGIAISEHSLDTNQLTVAPALYTDPYIEQGKAQNLTVDEVADLMIADYERHKEIPFNPSFLYDRDFLKNHVHIGLQRKTDCVDNNMVYADSTFDGIIIYMYIRIPPVILNGCRGTVTVTHGLLKKAGLTINELWNHAQKNTFAETKCLPLCEYALNTKSEDFEKLHPGIPKLFILTNHTNDNGASAILNRDFLIEFAKKHEVESIIMLPCSIHEVIIFPYDSKVRFPMATFSEIVQEVNQLIRPEDYLANRAYLFKVRDDK